MEQYRVLLVDDEEEIRAGISRRIDWEKLGFILSGEAQNGIEALEICEQIRPDVVITDIKMPFMDGLELGRKLRQVLPAAKLLILTGFDDFEYARQAVSINVFEYLLKPVDAEELSGVLSRLHQEIDDRRAEIRNAESIRQQYERALPMLRGMFCTRLLDGGFRTDEVYERMERYNLKLLGDTWTVALLHVGKADQNGEEMQFLTLYSLMKEQFDLAGCSYHSFIYQDNLAILCAFQKGSSIYAFLNELERVRRMAESETDLRLTIGVGELVKNLWELSFSAKGARDALDYRVILGSGRTIYIHDVEPRSSTDICFDETDGRDLMTAIKVGTEEQVRENVGRLMEKVKSSSLGQCQLFFLDWMNCLMKIARDSQISSEEVFGQEGINIGRLSDFSSPGQLGSWCCDRCLRLRELVGKRRSDSTWNLIDEAKDFIEKNYEDSELSVDTLCSHLHMSSAYFSTLFKKNTGMSFTAYVTRVRMEAAAELLRDTSEKTHYIAQKTGYIDANYFSYVFKRYFGVSPSKYRSGAADRQ